MRRLLTLVLFVCLLAANLAQYYVVDRKVLKIDEVYKEICL